VEIEVRQNAGAPFRISQVWILKLAALPMDFHVAGGVKWKIDVVSFSHLGVVASRRSWLATSLWKIVLANRR
jgi:hypothetical protein